MRLDGVDGDEELLGDLGFVRPSAASCATRRSLAVSASTPDRTARRGRAPVLRSSLWAHAPGELAAALREHRRQVVEEPVIDDLLADLAG